MSDSGSHVDVAVVGGGIVGAAVALRLRRDGRRVAWCLGADRSRGATAASGAMLGVIGEVVHDEDDAALALRVRAAQRHADWRAELGITAATAGTFVIASARSPADLRAATAMEAGAARHGIACQRADATDVPGLTPALGWTPARVLHLEDESWVDAPALLAALRRTASTDDEVVCFEEQVSSVEHNDERTTGVLMASGLPILCDEVVVCTGADAAALLAASGLDASLMPALLPAKGIGLQLARPTRCAPYRHVLRTPNRAFACGLHLVPRGNDAVYVGATNRVSAHPEVLGAVTAGELSLLLSQTLQELAAPLAAWDLASTTWGRRPLPTDGLPIAGRTAFPGLSVATGTYRSGVLLAPLLADVVAAEIRADRTATSNPFTPTRDCSSGSSAGVLRDGLADMAAQLADHSDVEWSLRLAPLLAALGSAAFGDDPSASRLRRHTRALLTRYPRLEMVPEALVELLQAEARRTGRD